MQSLSVAMGLPEGLSSPDPPFSGEVPSKNPLPQLMRLISAAIDCAKRLAHA